jgi:hypothetical protein
MFFGDWFARAVCREAKVVAPFQDPFATMRRRLFPDDLFGDVAGLALSRRAEATNSAPFKD